MSEKCVEIQISSSNNCVKYKINEKTSEDEKKQKINYQRQKIVIFFLTVLLVVFALFTYFNSSQNNDIEKIFNEFIVSIKKNNNY
jgi:hypothetical protein